MPSSGWVPPWFRIIQEYSRLRTVDVECGGPGEGEAGGWLRLEMFGSCHQLQVTLTNTNWECGTLGLGWGLRGYNGLASCVELD